MWSGCRTRHISESNVREATSAGGVPTSEGGVAQSGPTRCRSYGTCQTERRCWFSAHVTIPLFGRVAIRTTAWLTVRPQILAKPIERGILHGTPLRSLTRGGP